MRKFLILKLSVLFLIICTTYFIFTNHENQNNTHKLVVIVPFKNRFWQLLKFASHIGHFLHKQNVNHAIYVINQIDDYRFNRASLINVGFLESEKEKSDYIAIHDVDLLPQNDLISYGFPENSPFHLTPPHLHPVYNYSTYLGGILLMHRNQYRLVNGMSNLFWGWGREDDEFRLRLLKNNLNIFKPNNINTGKETFLHLHRNDEKRDSNLYYNQRILTFRLDLETGLHDTSYAVESRYVIDVDNLSSLNVINVKLNCLESKTPYCRSP